MSLNNKDWSIKKSNSCLYRGLDSLLASFVHWSSPVIAQQNRSAPVPEFFRHRQHVGQPPQSGQAAPLSEGGVAALAILVSCGCVSQKGTTRGFPALKPEISGKNGERFAGVRDVNKPSKTAGELEAAIKVEMEDICDAPTGVTISVQPDGDTWKVVIMEDSADVDPGRHDMIMLIADRLRSEFDLKA